MADSSDFGASVLGLSSLPGPTDWAPAGTMGNIGDLSTGGGINVSVGPPASAPTAPAAVASSAAPTIGQLIGGNLRQMLGTPPQQTGGFSAPSFMASLGAGLSSAGQNWNKPAAAAFASGAGAAIQGGQQFDNQLQSAKLKALQAAIAAWKVGDIAAYHQALTNFRAASAQQQRLSASASPAASNVPTNNPPAAPASVTGNAPSPAPSAATSGASAARMTAQDAIAQARDAIARGAPPDAVAQRLRDNGFDPALV